MDFVSKSLEGFLVEQRSSYSNKINAMNKGRFSSWWENSYEDNESYKWDVNSGNLIIYDEDKNEIDKKHIDSLDL